MRNFACFYLIFDNRFTHSRITETAENKEAQKYLNGNGLCKSKEDVSTIVPLLDHGDVEWNPCYVYKVEY